MRRPRLTVERLLARAAEARREERTVSGSYDKAWARTRRELLLSLARRERAERRTGR